MTFTVLFWYMDLLKHFTVRVLICVMTWLKSISFWESLVGEINNYMHYFCFEINRPPWQADKLSTLQGVDSEHARGSVEAYIILSASTWLQNIWLTANVKNKMVSIFGLYLPPFTHWVSAYMDTFTHGCPHIRSLWTWAGNNIYVAGTLAESIHWLLLWSV